MAPSHTLSLPGSANAAELAQGSIFFVGTATTVIRYGGLTLLTDPNFLHAGDHAHLGYGITTERLTDPAVEVEALPPLDLCVLSHMHGDHWDHVAEAKLPRTLPIVTTHHAARVLAHKGFGKAQGLATWDSLLLRKGEVWLRITAMPGRHAPGVLSTLLPPVMGSLLEWGADGEEAPRLRLYITGDTLLYEAIEEIPRRYPRIDLALLHLGGTRVLGLLVSMDARQGVQILRLIRPRTAIPIHYNDYTVFKSPLADFMKAVAEAGLDTEVHYLHHGDTYRFEVLASGR
ncbi:MAG: MBL fold metallo-hydrolase [Pseudomonadota bacterium]